MPRRERFRQQDVRDAVTAARREQGRLSIMARRAIVAQAEDQIRAGLTKAFKAAVEEAASQAQSLGQAVQQNETDYRQAMFQRLGELAQQSMLSSYDALVTRREGPASHSHYRQGQGRLAGGVLRDALGSPNLFIATNDGLNFGDANFLDSAAAHWHRINFGAGGRGAGSDNEFPVRLGDTSTALSFDEGPSPGFSMPTGFWLDGQGDIVRPGQNDRGADRFFPASLTGSMPVAQLAGTVRSSNIRSRPAKLRPTQGIYAANFMDAGLRRLADEIPYAYQKYIQDLLEKAISKVSADRRQIEIVQGPTSITNRARSGLTQGVSGPTGFRSSLP